MTMQPLQTHEPEVEPSESSDDNNWLSALNVGISLVLVFLVVILLLDRSSGPSETELVATVDARIELMLTEIGIDARLDEQTSNFLTQSALLNPSATPVPTATDTPVPTNTIPPTETPLPTATSTPSPTLAPKSTNTPTDTPTHTPSNTATLTATATVPATNTATSSPDDGE
ncbi:MAG: hypothetical protein CUN54_07265 [Phototrophicales bacterium]|nr:MAG: hypothetical protein CUN54_07265 [Phototrophicales bacterium]